MAAKKVSVNFFRKRSYNITTRFMIEVGLIFILILLMPCFGMATNHLIGFTIWTVVLNWYVKDLYMSAGIALIFTIIMYVISDWRFCQMFSREYFEDGKKSDEGTKDTKDKKDGDDEEEDIVEEVSKSSDKPITKEKFEKISSMQNDLLSASKEITETMKSLKPLLKQGIDIREQFQKLGLVK